MNAVDTQLVTADPADWPVAPGWQPLVGEFFASARGQALRAFLQESSALGLLEQERALLRLSRERLSSAGPDSDLLLAGFQA